VKDFLEIDEIRGLKNDKGFYAWKQGKNQGHWCSGKISAEVKQVAICL